MRIGYARVSSKDQNLARQLTSLQAHGAQKIYAEKKSGANFDRPELQKLLKSIKPNDVLLIHSLDRLGRDARSLTKVLQKLSLMDVKVEILNQPSFESVDDAPLRNMLTSILLEGNKFTAENERKRILERQREGIELAKIRGVYTGRKTEYCANSSNLKREKSIFK